MRKKRSINLAGKRDLDRQVTELRDFENLIKSQVRLSEIILLNQFI